MKNIFKTGKCSIAAILTLCILLGIAGTCVYAASVMPKGIKALTEIDNATIEHELVPMMANACPVYVPGIGWTGTQAWQDAITKVQEGGHIGGWGNDGTVYLSYDHAKLLIESAGLAV